VVKQDQSLTTANHPTVRLRTHRHTPGEAGMWVFILGDMAMFAVFFIVYEIYRSRNVALFNQSSAQLNAIFGVIYTLLLLTSSLAVVLGLRATRVRATSIAPWCFVVAFACGLGFFVLKWMEYSSKVQHGITPTTNEFWMYFYLLTGLHLFHLVFGLCVLTYLFVTSRKALLTVTQFAFIEGGGCYWHVVDGLWIAIFPLLYFVR
jgi:nitric oxide reductase NorE protein